MPETQKQPLDSNSQLQAIKQEDRLELQTTYLFRIGSRAVRVAQGEGWHLSLIVTRMTLYGPNPSLP